MHALDVRLEYVAKLFLAFLVGAFHVAVVMLLQCRFKSILCCLNVGSMSQQCCFGVSSCRFDVALTSL